ncbi:hypothetical protein F5Y19DRAFT_474717 [Xylariaceae sp. FL1651]|nr:hypothetical protein F5Y19DRAFT_474717 [Xylariaceae sp. FL1651]
MAFSTSIPDMSPTYFVENAPWLPGDTNKDREYRRIVIDVGEPRGTDCEAMLRKHLGVEKAFVLDFQEVEVQFFGK